MVKYFYVQGKGHMDTYWLLDKSYGSNKVKDDNPEEHVLGQTSSYQDQNRYPTEATKSGQISPRGRQMLSKIKKDVKSKGTYMMDESNDHDGGETM